jgi:(p)ppGpp synthase/HD superfamily hydrolase
MEYSDFVDKARLYAIEKHKNQRRWDRGPYITHPAAVAKSLQDENQEDIVIAVAWLHDVLEDTETSIQDLVREGFDTSTVNALVAITRMPNESYLDFILRVRRNKIARLVKIADIRHNLSDLDEYRYKKQLKEKYELAMFILGCHPKNKKT